MELNDSEKSVLRDVALRHQQGLEHLRLAQAEVQRRAAHLEAVVNTVTRLKGLDPAKFQFAYDLDRDLLELREIPEPPPAPLGEGPRIVGTMSAPDGPTDITAALGLIAEAAKLEEFPETLAPSEPEPVASAS